MKERYPFLYQWKLQGFNEFPTIPLHHFTVEAWKRRYLEYLKESEETEIYSILTKKKPSIKEFQDVIWPRAVEVARAGMKMADDIILEIIYKEVWNLALIVIEAEGKILKDEASKEQALKELGKKIFPETRGGKSIFTELQKAILKVIHEELKNCIKEIRRFLGIPLRKDPEWSWGSYESKDIKGIIPETSDIFQDNELQLIDNKKSISAISYDIITKRLRSTLRHSITPRTLKDLLDQVTPVSL
jgi:hypothetical protein